LKKISFIYLKAFSAQGGLEKFNRAMMKSLYDLKLDFKVHSLYDKPSEVNRDYLPIEKFNGAFYNRYFSFFKTLFKILIRPSQIVLVGHVNLAPLILTIKFFKPNLKVVLMAHGIEMWQNVNGLKIKFLRSVDQIWAVSQFTKDMLLKDHPYLNGKIKIFPNTLDPFFPVLPPNEKNPKLLERYGLSKGEKIVLTVARLSSSEGYKGYDRLVEVIGLLDDKEVRYLIVGKYDETELERIQKLAQEKEVLDQLYFCGYVSNDELIDHYQLADVFVMPSLQEGFGIVFIEALACGTPVIAGNLDGSVDALRNGELGTLVDPYDIHAIARAIERHFRDTENKSAANQKARIQKVHEYFGFNIFGKRLLDYLNEII
jgi:glycosyltransferase involved in cell wall biosynthesis